MWANSVSVCTNGKWGKRSATLSEQVELMENYSSTMLENSVESSFENFMFDPKYFLLENEISVGNEITVENVSSISNNSRDSFYEFNSKASSSDSSTSSSMDSDDNKTESDDNKTEFDIRNKKDLKKIFSFILNRLEALEY